MSIGMAPAVHHRDRPNGRRRLRTYLLIIKWRGTEYTTWEPLPPEASDRGTFHLLGYWEIYPFKSVRHDFIYSHPDVVFQVNTLLTITGRRRNWSKFLKWKSPNTREYSESPATILIYISARNWNTLRILKVLILPRNWRNSTWNSWGIWPIGSMCRVFIILLHC